jgi:hypothetical protein
VTGTDWLLSLHVLSAVTLGASLTAYWAVVVATRPGGPTLPRTAADRLNLPLTVAVSIGTLGTIVFGVWLAIVKDRYHPWDGWIVASIVLWAIASELGRRSGTAFSGDLPTSRRNGIVLHAASTVAVVAILVLMLWKPGA